MAISEEGPPGKRPLRFQVFSCNAKNGKTPRGVREQTDQVSQSAGVQALAPAWEELGDCCPAVAQLFVRRDYGALLCRSKVITAQHRVQLIAPSQTTALTVAVGNALCDEGPVPGAVGLDEKAQARIFLFSFFSQSSNTHVFSKGLNTVSCRVTMRTSTHGAFSFPPPPHI